jgi:hypothetical protein
MLPVGAFLSELSRRGHAVHLRTLSTGVEVARWLGFATDTIDSRIELPRINGIREELHLRPVGSMDEFWRGAPLLLVASGKPFEYPNTEWGDAVQMIGPCAHLIQRPWWCPAGWPR